MVESLLMAYALVIAIASLAFVVWVVVTHKRSKKKQHDIFIDQSKWGEE